MVLVLLGMLLATTGRSVITTGSHHCRKNEEKLKIKAKERNEHLDME